MTLYKVIVEQKITKRVLVIVDADSDEDAIGKARERNIIAAETTIDMKIDEFIPIETDKY
ncbi:hypothetical protein ACQKNX_22795 [Lysinibacillus sp. NPDC093712]|uniref:hypothetical protein n=1 Tax=Lysinibacillus sp. NPDC093712 TaxID=3390579 RepID=UPI003D07C929